MSDQAPLAEHEQRDDEREDAELVLAAIGATGPTEAEMREWERARRRRRMGGRR